MMMCSLKWGVFVFFGLWQTVALIFTVLLVPETRGVPIEKARLLAYPCVFPKTLMQNFYIKLKCCQLLATADQQRSTEENSYACLVVPNQDGSSRIF